MWSGVVVHCAGLAHRSGQQAPSADEYDEVNHRLAVRVAEAARAAGARRFVFVSSINVVAGHRFKALGPDLPYAPLSEYGKSKARAEESLLAMEGIEVVVARPPLVCGPGAPGNLRLLMQLCDSALPLPFGMANNCRTLIGSTNLASALHHLAIAPASDVAGKIFHPADAPISTKEIVKEARRALGRPMMNLPIPSGIVRAVLAALGRDRIGEQLFGDLIVSSSSIRLAGWSPENSALVEIGPMARTFAEQRRAKQK